MDKPVLQYEARPPASLAVRRTLTAWRFIFVVLTVLGLGLTVLSVLDLVLSIWFGLMLSHTWEMLVVGVATFSVSVVVSLVLSASLVDEDKRRRST
jgi:hypothetical protein